MGWDRQLPPMVEAPVPPMVGRWVLAGAVAVLASVLLFLLYASEQVPQLQALNIWALSVSPILVWVLAFGARAYSHGGAVNHHRFFEDEVQSIQQAWAEWAHRYLAVHASCVLLPDDICASVLTRPPVHSPIRTGEARRVAALPAQKEDRAQAGLQLLLAALKPVLQTMSAEQELRVTLLSDVDPRSYESLRDVWRRNWASFAHQVQPGVVTLAEELSYDWLDEKIKTASPAFELIIVVQVHGEAMYSDGLAAMLLCPDRLAPAWKLPVMACLFRPMPLNIDSLKSELPLFLKAQSSACRATGLLADRADWLALVGKIITGSGACGVSLKAEQQWIQESLCGLAGPLGHWLMLALGVEVVRHRHQPLMVLAKENSTHWIGTVGTGELV